MVYRFVDVNEEGSVGLSSIQVVINDINLDKMLPGYRTLNVSGRSVFGRDIETMKYSKRSNAGSKSTRSKDAGGSNMFFNSSVQGIEIQIDYRLMARNNVRFREYLTRLVESLHQEEAKRSFSDDEDFYYTGTLSDMGDFTESSNCILGSFTVVCTDPFKYSKEVKSKEFVTKASVGYDLGESLPDDFCKLESISMNLLSEGDSFRLKNLEQNLSIILSGKFSEGDKLVIKPDEDITCNGLNIMTRLDLLSDLEDFNIQRGDSISTSLPVNFTFKYRVRRY